MGNKNSGRRPLVVEMKKKMDAGEVLQLSIAKIKQILSDDKMPIELQAKCAIPIAAKAIPDRIEVDDVNSLTHEERIAIARSALNRIAALGSITIDANPL